MSATLHIGPFADLDSMFKDYIHPKSDKTPFDYLVVVAGRADSPGPRDPRWEHILDFGMLKLEKVLNHEPIGEGPHYFIFPDRWLQPVEAQSFEGHLKLNPDAKKFGKVIVVTNQPYVASSCLKEQVRIMRKA